MSPPLFPPPRHRQKRTYPQRRPSKTNPGNPLRYFNNALLKGNNKKKGGGRGPWRARRAKFSGAQPRNRISAREAKLQKGRAGLNSSVARYNGFGSAAAAAAAAKGVDFGGQSYEPLVSGVVTRDLRRLAKLLVPHRASSAAVPFFFAEAQDCFVVLGARQVRRLIFGRRCVFWIEFIWMAAGISDECSRGWIRYVWGVSIVVASFAVDQWSGLSFYIFRTMHKWLLWIIRGECISLWLEKL